MKPQEWIAYFEEINGRKPTPEEYQHAIKTGTFRKSKHNKFFKIFLPIIVISVILVGCFTLYSKRDTSKNEINSIATKEDSSSQKSQINKKIDKLTSEIEALKAQITESETIIAELEPTPMNSEELKMEDFSSVVGTWRNTNGDEFTFDEYGLVSDYYRAHPVPAIKRSDLSDRVVDMALSPLGDGQVGGGTLIFVPANISLPEDLPTGDTDQSDISQDRITGGQQYSAMLTEDAFYYRVTDDTELNAEKENLENFQTKLSKKETELDKLHQRLEK